MSRRTLRAFNIGRFLPPLDKADFGRLMYAALADVLTEAGVDPWLERIDRHRFEIGDHVPPLPVEALPDIVRHMMHNLPADVIIEQVLDSLDMRGKRKLRLALDLDLLITDLDDADKAELFERLRDELEGGGK